MSHDTAPKRHARTRVRRILEAAKLARYRLVYRKRLKGYHRTVRSDGNEHLTRAERSAIQSYWKPYGMGPGNLEWFRLFKKLNHSVDPRYIPEELFVTQIEPLLCRPDVAAAYHDKNQLDQQFSDLRRPETVLRNVYGHYYDADYQPLNRNDVLSHLKPDFGPLFLKPSISGTGSGQNVARVVVDADGFHLDENCLNLQEVEQIYVQDFLIQKAVDQHDSLSQFYSDSLNTIRIITLRLNDRLLPIAATFRMGNGSHVDNGHAGGLLNGIDLETGELTKIACDVDFRFYDRHPLTKVSFASKLVPSFDKVLEMACSAHERLRYFDQISCDIAVQPDGSPCLVEVNTIGQGVEPHQYLKGAPLFGENTDEVMQLVSTRSRLGWNI